MDKNKWLALGLALAVVSLVLVIAFVLVSGDQNETTAVESSRVLQKGQPDQIRGGYTGSGFTYLVVNRDYHQSLALPNENRGISYDILVRDNPTQEQLDATFDKDYATSFADFSYDQIFRYLYLKQIAVYDDYELGGNNQPLKVYNYQIPPRPARDEPLDSIRPGYWRIGEDLQLGTYQITATESRSPWPSWTPSQPVAYNPVAGFSYQTTPASDQPDQASDGNTSYCTLIYYSQQPSQPPKPVEESGLKLNEYQLSDGVFANWLSISVFKGDKISITLGPPLLAVAAPNAENGFYCGQSWDLLDD